MLEQRIYYTAGSRYGEGLLDFLSVAWISDPANPTKWIERTNYLPLVTAGQQPEFKTDTRALDAITGKDFDPAHGGLSAGVHERGRGGFQPDHVCGEQCAGGTKPG